MPKATKKSKKARKAIEEEVYSVERIINKKITNNKVYYYLKWHGYPESENTWEPEENLNCPNLIKEFEANFLAEQPAEAKSESKSTEDIPQGSSSDSSSATAAGQGKTGSKKSKQPKTQKVKVETAKGKTPINSSDGKAKNSLEKFAQEDGEQKVYVSGFAKKWEAEEILGATEEDGQMLFLIKWLVS